MGAITEFMAFNEEINCLRRIDDCKAMLGRLHARLEWAQQRQEIERISKLDFIQFAAIYIKK